MALQRQSQRSAFSQFPPNATDSPPTPLGRHVLVVPKDHGKSDTPEITSSLRAVAAGIWRMCTVFAWWDVSWWIGVLFSIGSMLFIIAACFYWVPLEAPSTEFPGESLYGGGILSFIGATLFQIGAVLLIVEAVNEDQTGCFGWALEQAFSHELSGSSGDLEHLQHQPVRALVQKCKHHHAKRTFTLSNASSAEHLPKPSSNRRWHWWPTLHELRTHYLYEIGFQASFQLAIGATVFYVSGIMALPGIVNKMSKGVEYGLYWLTYLVGGIFFIVSSAFYILETQQRWWKPAPHVLGWWIGVFNMIGSVGWTLSASLG